MLVKISDYTVHHSFLCILHTCKPVRVPMSPPFSAAAANIGHMSIRTGPRKELASCDESCFLLQHLDCWVRVGHLLGMHFGIHVIHVTWSATMLGSWYKTKYIISWKWYSLMAVASFSRLIRAATKQKCFRSSFEEHNNNLEDLWEIWRPNQ